MPPRERCWWCGKPVLYVCVGPHPDFSLTDDPAKVTDSRSPQYIEEYGHESWELDALEPSVLIELVRSNVEPLIEPDRWNDRIALQARTRAELMRVGEHWDEIKVVLNQRWPISDDELPFDEDELLTEGDE